MIADETQGLVNESIEKLFQWVIDQNYIGWDIYDGLNSPLLKDIRNPYLKVLILQGNKYSPINFRSLLKVEKGIDVKGMALFAQAYAILYRSSGDDRYLVEMRKIIDFLKEKSLKKIFGYDCWASHYFPYIGVDKITLAKDIPDIIGTSQAIMAFSESYNISNNLEEKEIAISATDFLVNELFHDDGNFPFFEYSMSPIKGADITLNASAQAMEAISKTLEFKKNHEYHASCDRVVGTLLQTQKENGSWDYSINRDGSTKRVQLDFHHGYIIDGLLAYSHHAQNISQINKSICKAADYYQNFLFRPDGRGYFRYPLPFPIDIHNQAQGIITFLKLQDFGKKYIMFAEIIAQWTIRNMQDSSGFFYYQKWPGIVNKIPHMRWAQAWMLLAMARYLELGERT